MKRDSRKQRNSPSKQNWLIQLVDNVENNIVISYQVQLRPRKLTINQNHLQYSITITLDSVSNFNQFFQRYIRTNEIILYYSPAEDYQVEKESHKSRSTCSICMHLLLVQDTHSAWPKQLHATHGANLCFPLRLFTNKHKMTIKRKTLKGEEI